MDRSRKVRNDRLKVVNKRVESIVKERMAALLFSTGAWFKYEVNIEL